MVPAYAPGEPVELLRFAGLVTLLVALLAILGTSQGTGPFVVDRPVDSLMRWCTFANVVAVTGLLLAASVAEQQRAQADLQSSHDELERRVDERTRDLAGSFAIEPNAQGGTTIAITYPDPGEPHAQQRSA